SPTCAPTSSEARGSRRRERRPEAPPRIALELHPRGAIRARKSLELRERDAVSAAALDLEAELHSELALQAGVEECTVVEPLADAEAVERAPVPVLAPVRRVAGHVE